MFAIFIIFVLLPIVLGTVEHYKSVDNRTKLIEKISKTVRLISEIPNRSLAENMMSWLYISVILNVTIILASGVFDVDVKNLLAISQMFMFPSVTAICIIDYRLWPIIQNNKGFFKWFGGALAMFAMFSASLVADQVIERSTSFDASLFGNTRTLIAIYLLPLIWGMMLALLILLFNFLTVVLFMARFFIMVNYSTKTNDIKHGESVATKKFVHTGVLCSALYLMALLVPSLFYHNFGSAQYVGNSDNILVFSAYNVGSERCENVTGETKSIRVFPTGQMSVAELVDGKMTFQEGICKRPQYLD
ncbi:hypothetical protein AB4169_05050 [Vibrio lentus]